MKRFFNSPKSIMRVLGALGFIALTITFIMNPTWPTPDKIFIYLLLLFVALGQSWDFFKKFAPFVIAILAYESLRGLAEQLNTRVEYTWMIDVDKWLVSPFTDQLPTAWLQDQLWRGGPQWYDFALYFVYMLHFVLPFALAIIIWKKRPLLYWRYVWSFVSLSFAGFLTFLAFPAAPPWLASSEGYIEPITRVSSTVWERLGIVDFPSVYNRISPNQVAAVPSLHAAYATLFSLFVFLVFGKKWGYISLIYPAAIYFGTVYQGEHYIIDELLGGLYAVAAYLLIGRIFKWYHNRKSRDAVRREKADDIVKRTDKGVSFSIKACRDYGVDWKKCLKHTYDLGFRRFRLMSYWDLHEQTRGEYDFTLLDEQLKIIKRYGGNVTMAIGMRQPRWPETHMPDWAKQLSKQEATEAYLAYHQKVIEHLKDEPLIDSWQLENEFWLRSFGEHFDFSRKRLKKEFNMIRDLDPGRPIIMTLARITSLPLRRPTPDIYGTSIYRVIYNGKSQSYTNTWAKPHIYKIKRSLIRFFKQRDLIIHELQTEPWGPKANWEMSVEEQDKSINAEQIRQAVQYADETGITYMDLWGAEWWYWRDDQQVTVAAKDVNHIS